MLGIVEGQIATIIRGIAADNQLPGNRSSEWQALLVFIALQASRTRISGDANDAMANYYAKTMAEGRPELEGIDLDQFKVVNTYPAALPMQISLKGYGYLNSLSCALLLNNTRIPFIASDNPVILYNSQRSHVRDEGVIGLDTSGLQVFYALDPERALYLYDEHVYSRPTNTGIRVIRSEDVIKLNLIHYMWSDRSLYCPNPKNEALLQALHAASSSYLPFERVCFRESNRVANDDGTQSSLMHNYRAQPPIEAAFSFAKYGNRVDGRETGMRSCRYHVSNDIDEGGRSYQFARTADTRAHLKGAALGKAIKTIQRQAA